MCTHTIHTHIPLQLSADNYQLREELRQEVHHHELIKKSIEGEERQLELKMSCASVCMRAVQRAVEDMGKMDQKSLKTIPCKTLFTCSAWICIVSSTLLRSVI